LHHARDSIELCRRWGEKNYLSFAYTAMAKTLQAMGDAGSALDAIQQARQAATDPAPSVIALVTAQEIQIRLAQGDTAAAQRWARASELNIDDELGFYLVPLNSWVNS
jgi:ATP/maltotriose-dependent transcriptional regulator MalT